jgi:hypothetical protein
MMLSLLTSLFMTLALLALPVAMAEEEDTPVIRAVDSPAARFDTLAQELLSQPEPLPQAKTWHSVAAPGVAAPGHTANRSTPQLTSKDVVSGPLPTLQWTPRPDGLPLMKRSLHGANHGAVPAARQIISTRLNNSATVPTLNEKTSSTDAIQPPDETVSANSTTPHAEVVAAGPKVQPPVISPVVFPPLLKVPGWLWGTLAAVFVGVALLAISATVWLLQRMWLQNRPSKTRPIAVVTAAEASETVKPPLTMPKPPDIKPYASMPRTRRALEVRRLLKPTPNTVNEVLSQWVAQVSQARQG